jgi:hypothetical protein
MKQFLHDRADLLMDRPAFFYQKALIDHLLSQGMLEDVFQVRLKGSGLDQVEALQTCEAFIDIFLQVTDPCQYLIEE